MPPGLSSTYVTTSIDSTVVRRMYLAVVIPAMLFAAEVMRMYMRVAQSMGWQTAVVGNNLTDTGGVKDAIVEIKGHRAYDTLRWESGVHRVQRVKLTRRAPRPLTLPSASAIVRDSEHARAVTTMDRAHRLHG